jgi:hypothetical protein
VEGASSNRKQQSAKQYRRQFVQVPAARTEGSKIRSAMGIAGTRNSPETSGAQRSTLTRTREIHPTEPPVAAKGKQLPGARISPDFVVGNGQYD